MEQITNIQEKVLGIHERNYKDTLFRKIFGAKDKRSSKWRLELYNALSGKDYTNPDDLEITTLENVLFIKMKNDVSFLVDSQMTLWEHQSTLNPNMPLRGLFYFSLLYQNYLLTQDEALFTTKLTGRFNQRTEGAGKNGYSNKFRPGTIRPNPPPRRI